MNTPTIKTKRLLLRKFTEKDLDAIFKLHSDKEVNAFLPWFPLKSIEDAETFFKTRIEPAYSSAQAYYYVVCLQTDERVIGYVDVSDDDSHDLGYGLSREFWHSGIITEACEAVIEQLKRDGVPYITATHDINNPRSGEVMRRLGMKYQYSYEEQWQPKDILVTFRMYQLNLDGNDSRAYKKYWNNSAVHFIEAIK